MRIVLANRLTSRLQHGGYVNSGGPDQCFSSLAHLEAPPSWVRLMFFNDQSDPRTVDGAACAPTSEVGDGFTPMNGGVPDASLWRRVTFNAEGGDCDPLTAGSGAAFALHLPPGTEGRPVVRFSDWMPVAGLPRADGGAGSLLLVRAYSAGVTRYSGALGLPDPILGRIHAGFWATGNGAAPPWTFSARPFNGLFASFGLQYIAAAVGATVVGIGDSIMHGMASTGALSSFGARACALVSAPERPVSYVNEGYVGRRSADYCGNGIWDIEHLRPQVALIQTWSQNDPNTQDGADLGFARAMAVADVALRHECVPVLVTAAPVFVGQPERDAFRRSNIDRVRAAGQRGFDVLDLDALWGTGDVPNAYRAEFDSGDHTHQTDAACAVAADALAAILVGSLSELKQYAHDFNRAPSSIRQKTAE